MSKLSQLFRVAASADSPASRLFALGELVLFPVSLLTLVALPATAALRSAGVEVPVAWSGYVLPLLCTGAVGYLTNYLAVRMLFEPYSRTRPHWLRWLTLSLWRQGLVPSRKPQLAEAVAAEVAGRLLTPQVITEEIRRLAAAALDDDNLQEEQRRILPRILRDHLPGVLAKLTPEAGRFLQENLFSGLDRAALAKILEGVLEAWLAEAANRDFVIDKILGLIEDRAPEMVAVVKRTADGYQPANQLEGMIVEFAKAQIQWGDIEATFRGEIHSGQTREALGRVIDELPGRMAEGLSRPDAEAGFAAMRDALSEKFGPMIGERVEAGLPGWVESMTASDSFWKWVDEEALPKIKPMVLDWIGGETLDGVGKKFDVAGRVRKAVDEMNVETVHEMVDTVAAEQLGAIQVLGFVLGLIAGIPLVILS